MANYAIYGHLCPECGGGIASIEMLERVARTVKVIAEAGDAITVTDDRSREHRVVGRLSHDADRWGRVNVFCESGHDWRARIERVS